MRFMTQAKINAPYRNDGHHRLNMGFDGLHLAKCQFRNVAPLSMMNQDAQSFGFG